MTELAFPLPPAPDVPPAELAERLARTRREMAAARIDVVVLTARTNIDYYADHRTLTWAYHARPIFGVITPTRFVLVTSRAELRNIALQPRPFDAAPYDGYLAEAVAAVIAVVAAEDPGARAIVGLDYGQDLFGRGSLELVDGLRDRQGAARVTSAASAIWRVRMIKSAFEAGLKRAAFAIVDAAFDQAIGEARLGMTEVELQRRIQATIILNGAERADPIAMLFSRGDFIYNRLPGDRKLEDGHYIWTDFRSTYGGYPADRNRIARAGAPSAWELRTYATVRAVTIELCRSVRPGMTGGDLYRRFEQLWGEADLGPLYAGVSRVGHGGGLDVTEPPSISAASREPIEPGMILHLEPKLEANGAVFQFEEIVLVGADGPEFLCPLQPAALPVVPV